MDSRLQQFLAELAETGRENDALQTERQYRMLNITEDTGRFLSILIQSAQARHILEIGTSNGYSTLWLADAARSTGGRVATVELSAAKVALAKQNFVAAGLDGWICSHHIDAAGFLATAATDLYDFIFLDAQRSQYERLWPELDRVLRAGGLLVIDNAVSHRAELADLQRVIADDERLQTVLVPVGKGELVIFKGGR